MKKIQSDICSGKDIAYENFPVGSWLLPASLRPHILTLYYFARSADDIADSPNLAPDEKIKKLMVYEDTITRETIEANTPTQAKQMVQSLKKTNITRQYCLDLLAAFKRDAKKLRYKNWEELIDYCLLSAAPVGRYMIDLHGGLSHETKTPYEASDSLCTALQILNHLQDCKDDYKILDRVYLPIDIVDSHNATLEDLSCSQLSPELRRCLNDILDRVDGLIKDSHILPSSLKSKRLAMETQVIINIAHQLSKKLRQKDPIKQPIRLSKSMYLYCCLLGILGLIFS